MAFLAGINIGLELIIGPAVSKVDGVTPNTSLTLANLDSAQLFKGSSTVVDLKTDGSTLVHLSNGVYSLVIVFGSISIPGPAKVLLRQDANILPVWENLEIIQGDSLNLVQGLNAATNQFSFFDSGASPTTKTQDDVGTLDVAERAAVALRTWDELIAAHSTPATFGFLLDQAVSSRATPPQVNAEVLDVIAVDLFATPGAEIPTTTSTIQKMVSLLYKAFINEVQQTGSEYRLLNNAGTVVDQKATVDDDGSKFTRGKLTIGP